MQKLKDSVHSLFTTIAAARDLAEAHKGKAVDALKIQANLLLLKMLTQAIAIVRATPIGPLRDANLPIWDLSTAASNARSILESYLLFFHLFVETVSVDDKSFRFAIWLRHGLAENEKFRAISGTPAPKDWAKQISDANDLIRTNPLFTRLDPNQQSNALRGEKSTVPKLDTLTPRTLSAAAISKDLYDLVYRYCSAFVHTTFFTVEQLEQINAQTGEGLAPFSMIAAITNVFLLLIIRDYVMVFPELAGNVTPQLQQQISDAEKFVKMTTADWAGFTKAQASD
jgi:hypothetical protein